MGREILQSYERVTALQINRYDENNKKEYSTWLPQFELVEYYEDTGYEIHRTFVCINDVSTESGMVECDTEIEALEYAIAYRDKLKNDVFSF